MDFKELEYILIIAQEKTISKAAERLYISQPALSRALVKIEDHIGTPLFNRKNRQYIPTYIGELYLDMARNILNTHQNFLQQTKQYMEDKGGTITIGITPGRGRTMLPKILPDFREAFPDCKLEIVEEDVEALEEDLRNNKVEIAFFTMTYDTQRINEQIQYELLSREEIVLCTPKLEEYRLLASDRHERKYPWIDIRMLKNETFLLLHNNMRLGQFSEKILQQYNMQSKIMYLRSIDTALALVGQRYGVAFASSFRLEEHNEAKDIYIFSFGEDVCNWDFVVAYPTVLQAQQKKSIRYLINLFKNL